jgi:uncharacterized membrane protein YiaA
MSHPSPKPTGAFIGASWTALLCGMGAYGVGLWNANMALNEKGYYLTVILLGLFAAVSLQKTVRDRLEGIRVTNLYFGLCWMAVIAALLLLSTGLWNAEALSLSEKGFYAMAFLLGLFGAITVQKNVRDVALVDASPSPLRPGEDKAVS